MMQTFFHFENIVYLSKLRFFIKMTSYNSSSDPLRPLLSTLVTSNMQFGVPSLVLVVTPVLFTTFATLSLNIPFRPKKDTNTTHTARATSRNVNYQLPRVTKLLYNSSKVFICLFRPDLRNFVNIN